MAVLHDQTISRALDLVNGSPVRRIRNTGRTMPEPGMLDSIDEIPRRLEGLLGRLAEPLTLTVLGEVKAGKSTLVNALVGTDVAPIDILEATQWIMVIRHGASPSARIEFEDGTAQEGTPEEIHNLLFSRRQDPDFVARCTTVTVTLPQQSLTRLHLVDTPGLATMTESARTRTQNYLSEVDAVLWVLNANHLGQVDVVDALAEVARLGKPILVVINRVDEVEASPERLKRYVKMHLSEYVQEVFAVSARQARMGQEQGDLALLEASGLPALVEYLREHVDRRTDEVQATSFEQQVAALLQMDRALHESYAHQLNFVVGEAAEHRRQLDLESRRIQGEARLYLEQALEEYVRLVRQNAEDQIVLPKGLGALFSGGIDEARVQALEGYLRSALGGEAFQQWAQDLGPKVEAFLQRKWQDAVGRLEVQTRERFETFYSGETQRLAALEVPSTLGELWTGVKEGLTSGGLIGAGLAAYAAGIGPAAAYVTLGSALSAMLPPALVVGALTGAVLRVLRSGQQAEQLRVAVRDAVVQQKQALRSQWLEAQIFPALEAYNGKLVETLDQHFRETICQGWSEEELNGLLRDVNEYVAQLSGTLHAAPSATRA